MKYRNPKKDNDLFRMIDHEREVMRNIKGINKLNSVIDWECFREELEMLLGYDVRDSRKGGRPPFDAVLMFKVLVLQKYHGLSDDEAEYQIKDRFSFMQFLGLQPGDSIPDAKTIWDFKQLLEMDGREGSKKLFDGFVKMLREEGMIGCEGSIVDASFVDAPRQRNSREQNECIKQGERPEEFSTKPAKGRQKDCDARWTKKNNETHYGYKNHAKVDAKSKLITDYVGTSANVHDSQVFEELVGEEDEAVFADSAYLSESNREHLLAKNCQDFILLKGTRGHPLNEEEKATNKLRSRIRVRCEHVFGRMSQLAMDRLRSIGRIRANHHIALSNLVYNMDRYAFLLQKA
jgi:transposase, IS5 family